MADPPSVQSDEMDAVSSDWDRAEPGAADANRLVRPLRVKNASGQVTNALALVAGHHDSATLKWNRRRADDRSGLRTRRGRHSRV
jgi:hypothetical protein